jgi:hypothetical protein
MKQINERERSGAIKTFGALTSPALVLRLTRLLSVN